MVLFDFQEIVNELMTRKQSGMSIRQSLKDMGISRGTYYRWVDENGFGKWTDLPYTKRVYAKTLN